MVNPSIVRGILVLVVIGVALPAASADVSDGPSDDCARTSLDGEVSVDPDYCVALVKQMAGSILPVPPA